MLTLNRDITPSYLAHAILISGKSNASSLEAYSAKLFNTVKDHNCPQALQLLEKSYEQSVQDECSNRGFSIRYVQSQRAPKPLKLVLKTNLPQRVGDEIERGLEQIKFCDLDMEVVNLKKEGNPGKKRIYDLLL